MSEDKADPALKAPRQPSQKRSRERYEKLVEATRALVLEREISQIGIYDIAKKAEVPSASVYHFFPSVEAALVELSRRQLERLEQTLTAPMPVPETPFAWQDVMALRFWRAVDFYNGDTVAQRLFLSGSVLAAMRRIEDDRTRALAASYHDLLVPYLPQGMPEGVKRDDFRFRMITAIFEGSTMAIYAEHGFLPRERCIEALKAMIAYAETFLPK